MACRSLPLGLKDKQCRFQQFMEGPQPFVKVTVILSLGHHGGFLHTYLPFTQLPDCTLYRLKTLSFVPVGVPPPPTDDAPILLVHDASILHLLYAVCDTVFMANSLAPGCTGESLAAPAVAGCAVLVGPHAGPSTIMVEDLNSAAVVAAEEAAAAVRNAGEWQQRCAPVIAAWSGFFDGDAVWGHMLYRTHGRLAALPVVQPNSARTGHTNAIQCAELVMF